jgi:glycosyltransferase involved in cell wall biosynthesis
MSGSIVSQARTSVVIPCYKHDDYLAEAIESVDRQTIPAREIIVIDDGSPVPLQTPIRESRVPLVWIRTANGGLGAARNRGLAEARGEFIAFLDADDAWESRKLEQQQHCLDEFPKAVACYTECIQAPGFFGFGPYPDPQLDADSLAARLWKAQFFPPSSVLMRTDIARSAGGFREGLRNGEDLDMWFRLLHHGAIVGVSEPLTRYRVHEHQITQDDVRKIFGAKEARRGILDDRRNCQRLFRAGIASNQLWDAYRSEIHRVYFRRRFAAARPMLWDFWKQHPLDFQTLRYLLITLLPVSIVTRLRGQI